MLYPKTTEITEEEHAIMDAMIFIDRCVILTTSDNKYVQQVRLKFNKTHTKRKKKFKNNDRTAKLWVQCFQMSTLTK